MAITRSPTPHHAVVHARHDRGRATLRPLCHPQRWRSVGKHLSPVVLRLSQLHSLTHFAGLHALITHGSGCLDHVKANGNCADLLRQFNCDILTLHVEFCTDVVDSARNERVGEDRDYRDRDAPMHNFLNEVRVGSGWPCALCFFCCSVWCFFSFFLLCFPRAACLPDVNEYRYGTSFLS